MNKILFILFFYMISLNIRSNEEVKDVSQINEILISDDFSNLSNQSFYEVYRYVNGNNFREEIEKDSLKDNIDLLKSINKSTYRGLLLTTSIRNVIYWKMSRLSINNVKSNNYTETVDELALTIDDLKVLNGSGALVYEKPKSLKEAAVNVISSNEKISFKHDNEYLIHLLFSTKTNKINKNLGINELKLFTLREVLICEKYRSVNLKMIIDYFSNGGTLNAIKSAERNELNEIYKLSNIDVFKNYSFDALLLPGSDVAELYISFYGGDIETENGFKPILLK